MGYSAETAFALLQCLSQRRRERGNAGNTCGFARKPEERHIYLPVSSIKNFYCFRHPRHYFSLFTFLVPRSRARLESMSFPLLLRSRISISLSIISEIFRFVVHFPTKTCANSILTTQSNLSRPSILKIGFGILGWTPGSSLPSFFRNRSCLFISCYH